MRPGNSIGLRAWVGATVAIVLGLGSTGALGVTILNPGTNDTVLQVTASDDGTLADTSMFQMLGSPRDLSPPNAFVGAHATDPMVVNSLSFASYSLESSLFEINS